MQTTEPNETAHRSFDGAAPRRPVVEIAVLSTVALLLAIDLVTDAGAGQSWLHLSGELGAVTVAVLGAVWIGVRWSRARRALEAHVDELRAHLDRSRADVERWKQEARSALAGLGEAIDRQFERWKLTDAERDVALLLLKGLSLKEIANVRGTSERTVRQQSLAVYKKAGLAGRAELSAFFLEDLLLPPKSDASA